MSRAAASSRSAHLRPIRVLGRRRWRVFSRDAQANRLFLWGLAIAGVVLIADQASKYWVLEVLDLDQPAPYGRSIEVLPFFNLSMVWNRGVSFGLLAGDGARYLLSLFSLLVAAGLIVWLASIRRPLLTVGVAGVIGGAVGNLIDRLTHGAVVDFLDFSGLYFPWVFNVADAGISCGVGLILLENLLRGAEPQSQ
ncbi:MAG: signal peptidase II [Pseudomonadota bacterium]